MQKTDIRKSRARQKKLMARAAACVLAAGLAAAVPSSRTMGTSTDELESANRELESEIGEQESSLEDIKNDIDDTEAALEELESEIMAIEESISEYENEMKDIEAEIAAISESVADEEEQMASLYARMALRIRYFYEDGTDSLLESVFSSDSFGDLLRGLQITNELVEYDRGQMEQIYATVADIEEAKAELQDKYDAIEALKASQEQEMELLKEKEEELSEFLEEAYSEEYEAEEAIAELESEYAKNSVQIDAIIAGYSEGAAADLSSLIWPLPSPYLANRVTSYYGYRSVSTGSTYHQGIDIAAPYGTEIYAALSGTVIISGYSGSCGYYVVLYHGNGIYTHYYHMCKKSPLETGDTVGQGDTIGYVGSTGVSTGAHLHFAISTDGIWEGFIDPYPYLEAALAALGEGGEDE